MGNEDRDVAATLKSAVARQHILIQGLEKKGNSCAAETARKVLAALEAMRSLFPAADDATTKAARRG